MAISRFSIMKDAATAASVAMIAPLRFAYEGRLCGENRFNRGQDVMFG